MFDLISALLVLKISIFRSTINPLFWAFNEPCVITSARLSYSG